VNPDPRVAAVAAPNRTDVGLGVDFSAALAGGTSPFSYAWSFGDGNGSAVVSPTHAYASPGLYAVHVNVSDALGQTTRAEIKVRVDTSLDVVNVTLKQHSVRVGKAVNFTVNLHGGTLPYVFAWNFGDGTRGGDVQSIAHIFLSTGPFLVKVTVRDAAGEVGVVTLRVTVT
jgi:PKD repeat protein